jgi:hypothetical protein
LEKAMFGNSGHRFLLFPSDRDSSVQLASQGLLKLDCAENIQHAFQVVNHTSQTDLRLRASHPAEQEIAALALCFDAKVLTRFHIMNTAKAEDNLIRARWINYLQADSHTTIEVDAGSRQPLCAELCADFCPVKNSRPC